MRAVVCSAYGPPENLRIEERPSPPLAPGQARIRVGAAAVNFPDVLVIADRYQISVPPPFVPGSEFAGVVDEVAGDVGDLAVGDRVTGTGIVGAFAEEVVAKASSLKRIPDGIDDRTAAAFGVAHRTAYHTLRSVARLQPGERLLVLGAGGGVGLAAVQLGVALGASVTAVASSAEKLDIAAKYGAEHLVDHRSGDLRTALKGALPEGADVVIDPVGGDLSEPALRSLRRGGRFVTVGYASGVIPRIPLNLVLVKGVRILGFQFQDLAADELARNEKELVDLLVTGRAVPHIGGLYPLDDAAEALRYVADGRAIGKIVIAVRSRPAVHS
ncbi:NADPH:quinone oxidoreductase family protein [Rhodococcus chondri]|uniref:NADPH:quinone oxidoreductase family protein n=1 Tax=Rhodococcus chondri TaxID=3065941 RepID=A0ABU7JL04_9NOCA|nr:NADPH:quinone oxidoreductase family protein [Rhodococcus sp. CC-R104]MEE2030701.1 NADPH:quinone oxidoreductase family protein [Rhodococcus sp. CC-R104]